MKNKTILTCTWSRVVLVSILVLSVIYQVVYAKAPALDVKTYIPDQAFQYFPVIQSEQDKYFPDVPTEAYLPALIEHESCISLKHKKCWNPQSELNTDRELGIGLGQLTKTYRKDGSIRFDILTETRNKYQLELKELSWSNVRYRPDLQIRTMVLMTRDNYKRLYKVSDPGIRLHFADAAYNGGLGGVLNERQACSLKRGCDAQQWFGHVEHTCLKSKAPLYGNRSACDINRHHVSDVFKTRLNKYELYFKDED